MGRLSKLFYDSFENQFVHIRKFDQLTNVLLPMASYVHV